MRKGRVEHYNVLVNVDLCYISTVQTTGTQKGSSQNGTCACSTTHWPWPWVLKYSYLLSMSVAYKQLFLLLWNINLCSPRWYQLVAELVLPFHTKPPPSWKGKHLSGTRFCLLWAQVSINYSLPAPPGDGPKQGGGVSIKVCSETKELHYTPQTSSLG